MAEPRYVHELNGTEVESSDINLLAEVGALADDHMLAELLRLAPFAGSVARAIVPFDRGPTVAPNGASGSVKVSPFRAIVGSRDTAQSIGPRANWSDLRSGIFTGANTLAADVSFAANPSTLTRWDLVYAALAVDAVGETVPRFRKDPLSEQVTLQNVVRTRVQRVTVDVVQGNAATNPQKPSLPPDAGGNHFFPLAYVRIPAGFGANSIVSPGDIDEVLPFVQMAQVTGVQTMEPANQHHAEGGTILSNPAFAWGTAGGQRPAPFIPPTMVGGHSLLVAMDLRAANPVDRTHQTGSVIDDRDWRFRIWQWHAYGVAGANANFAWDRAAANVVVAPFAGAPLARFAWGMGQSFFNDTGFAPLVAAISNTNMSEVALASGVNLYVDLTDGKLKVNINGNPGVLLIVWLTASGRFGNY